VVQQSVLNAPFPAVLLLVGRPWRLIIVTTRAGYLSQVV